MTNFIKNFLRLFPTQAYVTWYSLSNFFFPFVVLLFCYCNMCTALWNNFKKKKEQQQQPQQQQQQQQQLRRGQRQRQQQQQQQQHHLEVGEGEGDSLVAVAVDGNEQGVESTARIKVGKSSLQSASVTANHCIFFYCFQNSFCRFLSYEKISSFGSGVGSAEVVGWRSRLRLRRQRAEVASSCGTSSPGGAVPAAAAAAVNANPNLELPDPQTLLLGTESKGGESADVGGGAGSDPSMANGERKVVRVTENLGCAGAGAGASASALASGSTAHARLKSRPGALVNAGRSTSLRTMRSVCPGRVVSPGDSTTSSTSSVHAGGSIQLRHLRPSGNSGNNANAGSSGDNSARRNHSFVGGSNVVVSSCPRSHSIR